VLRDDDRHTGYTNSKSGRAEYNQSDAAGLRRDIARHRGAAHPLCFTDEVMDHEFPEGFKPVNIESYDVIRLQHIYNFLLFHAIILSILNDYWLYYTLLYYFWD